jgi:hypothetical protein
VATLRTLDDMIAMMEHGGYPSIKSGLNINLISTHVLSNLLDRICIFKCLEGQPRGHSVTPLHFQLPSGHHLFLWILLMIHNLLEQLMLISFLVDLTQEVFSQ